MAQPTLGPQVDELEQELSVVLFERVGRVSMTALGQSQALEGTISISVSEIYATVL
jgi:DNA-binding transcriptional LysR family regulator